MEIVIYRRERVDYGEQSDTTCLVPKFACCFAGPSEFFTQRFSFERSRTASPTRFFKGLGWSQSSKSQCESNFLSTYIPLVPCLSAFPFLRYSIFKIWLWKSKVKVIAQGHKVGITPYQLISLSFNVERPAPWRQYPSSPEGWGVKIDKDGFTEILFLEGGFHDSRGSHSPQTNFDSGLGLAAIDNNPFPKPVVTFIYDITWCHLISIRFSKQHFRGGGY